MLQAGQRLDEYQIIKLFASGGMGEIYLAEEIALSRQVAIKVIRLEAIKYPNSEEARKVIQLFRREAAAIARLNHPSILPLFKFGETTLNAESFMYMVMPYCQEKSLPDWMDTHAKNIFSPQEANFTLKQAADALQYAHDQGIIHLDVKPPNFLVRYPTNDASQLSLQLADFGIAKFTATTSMSQSVRGTLAYMAPEQWEGQPVCATDQYALAVMMYRLLTGQLPFTGLGLEQLWLQHRNTQPQPPSAINSSISSSVDAAILRALGKKPGDRFPSVEAFANAYQQALQLRSTEYVAIRQTLTLSPQEASRGTTRTLTLPSGGQLPITIAPGVSQGQTITIARPNAPTIILTIQIFTASASPPLAALPRASQPKPTIQGRERSWDFRSVILVILGFAGGLYLMGYVLIFLFVPINTNGPVFGGIFTSNGDKVANLTFFALLSIACFGVALFIISKRRKARSKQ